MGASKFWKLFYLRSCKPHPHWYQAQCESKSTMKNVQQKKKKRFMMWEIYVFYFILSLSLLLACLLDIAFISRRELKVGCFFENSWSWADAFLSWKDQRRRINILRIRQRKRNALCLCVACWWGRNQPFFLNISLSL